jgi:hypothetical protein
MPWTDPVPELSEDEKIFEELKELPIRDHTVVVGVMTLITAFTDASKIEASFFKDLSFAVGKTIKHATTLDTLNFLVKQLEKFPETSIKIEDLILLLSMMMVGAKTQAEKATTDTMRLVALLPDEADDARK